MKKIKSIVLLVNDQQEALDFYTQKLGFEVKVDAPFDGNNRWLTIALPDQPELEVILSLAKTDEAKSKVGNQLDAENALLGITTDEINADLARLTEKKVDLTSDLMDEPYGKFVFFKDLYGNSLYFHEAK